MTLQALLAFTGALMLQLTVWWARRGRAVAATEPVSGGQWAGYALLVALTAGPARAVPDLCTGHGDTMAGVALGVGGLVTLAIILARRG